MFKLGLSMPVFRPTANKIYNFVIDQGKEITCTDTYRYISDASTISLT